MNIAQDLASLAILRQNRRAFRERGMTTTSLQYVETLIALRQRNPRAGLADVARVWGIHRSTVLKAVRRAEAIGLLIRIGRAYILNAKGILRTAADATKQRLAHAKALILKRKSRFVAQGATHTGPDINQRAKPPSETPSSTVIPDRSTALAELAAVYIPLHQRKHRK